MVYDTDERDGKQDGMYEDWLSDNLAQLKDDYIEDNPDAFSDYCRNVFRNKGLYGYVD